jgi:hypothetical protein
LETTFFSEHNLVILEDEKGKKFHVVSEKHHLGQPAPAFKEYEEIVNGKTYALVLKPVLFPVHFETRGERMPKNYELGYPIWANDSIYVPLFYSPNISTKFVELLQP